MPCIKITVQLTRIYYLYKMEYKKIAYKPLAGSETVDRPLVLLGNSNQD
jgi:hypothetical protein